MPEKIEDEIDTPSTLFDGDIPDGSFYAKYEPQEVLGRGLCSVVRRCVDKVTKESYAVKIIDLTRKDNKMANQARESGHNEINLLRMCSDDPYIIQLQDAFETPAFLFLVFELCPNGELFDLLTTKVRLSEKRTRVIMRQLLESLSFLHSRNVMHRDIKCENILFDSNMNIRLSDFGFSAVLDDNVCFKETLGTPGYLSPEMLKASMYADAPGYGLTVDMWACGVVMYSMIGGTPPFYNRKQMKMLRDIMEGNYHFPSPDWDDVSEHCKDLIRRMLTVEPRQRITAKQALEHPFFAVKEVSAEKDLRKKLKAVFLLSIFTIRLQRMSKLPQPISMSNLRANAYGHKPLRKLIDSSAFNIYGHWVKRTDEQNRAALFERKPKAYHNSHPIRRRYRLLSSSENTM